ARAGRSPGAPARRPGPGAAPGRKRPRPGRRSIELGTPGRTAGGGRLQRSRRPTAEHTMRERMSTILITGPGGLTGSEAAAHYGRQGHTVLGIENNMRRQFFGPGGDVLWNIRRLCATVPGFVHVNLDIRDREGLARL